MSSKEAPRAKAVSGVLVKWYGTSRALTTPMLAVMLIGRNKRFRHSDPAMKEFILYTNEQAAEHFVIDDNLDDNHVVIKPEYVQYVQEELEKLQDTLSYNPGFE